MLYYDLAVFGYQVTCLIAMSAVFVCTELEIYYCHTRPRGKTHPIGRPKSGVQTDGHV